jgi:hypothetical protein
MLLSPARIEGRVASDNSTPNRRPDNILWFRQRVGFAERRAEGVWARRFGRQNAATESGNAGTEIVLGERFPSVTVFGLFLARGGHQTMKRSISIYH